MHFSKNSLSLGVFVISTFILSACSNGEIIIQGDTDVFSETQSATTSDGRVTREEDDNQGDAPVSKDEDVSRTTTRVSETRVEEEDSEESGTDETDQCVADGGVYNSALEECFSNSSDSDEDIIASAQEKMEIQKDDDVITIERKECVAEGGVYNTQLKECFTY